MLTGKRPVAGLIAAIIAAGLLMAGCTSGVVVATGGTTTSPTTSATVSTGSSPSETATTGGATGGTTSTAPASSSGTSSSTGNSTTSSATTSSSSSTPSSSKSTSSSKAVTVTAEWLEGAFRCPQGTNDVLVWETTGSYTLAGRARTDTILFEGNKATFNLTGGKFTTGYYEVKGKSLDSFVVPTGTTGLVTIVFPEKDFGKLGFSPDYSGRDHWLMVCVE